MIPVRNVYYMLAYAFQTLRELGCRELDAEAFSNTAELLAAILCRSVSVQIKRGLACRYAPRQEALSMPRGQADLAGSLKARTLPKRQLLCSYDELTPDVYANRIIKTTLTLLLRADISAARKRALRRLLLHFDGVRPVSGAIQWELAVCQGSAAYRTILAVCRFAVEGLLQSTAGGPIRMMDYADDQSMARLYEKFLLAYFRREHPELEVRSSQILWQVTDGYRQLLPTMQSDIVLFSHKTGKILIIDAKYYTHTLQTNGRYLNKTIHSANLYQIFTYVKNWAAGPGETVSGMLLYARTDEPVQPDHDYQMNGNQISVKTVDLSCPFSGIAAQLDAIADRVAK